jgi:HAD superfamily hydrolase (TIGR01450 family)
VALADEFDGFLIDLDGVVWIGREPVPGSAETLRALIGAGKEIVFVTNNPGRHPAVYAERLGELGVETGEQRIVTAGMATVDLAVEETGVGATAFVIGAEAFKQAAAAAGLDTLDGDAAEDSKAVLVSGHRGSDYEELLTATLAVQRGAALFATSRDPTLPMPGGEWPGTGSILAAVETATGATAQIGGKPEPHLFELAAKRVGGGRVAMVGDRIASDIEGGRRAGLETILVLTGAADRAEAEAAEPPPSHVVDDLAALLR